MLGVEDGLGEAETSGSKDRNVCFEARSSKETLRLYKKLGCFSHFQMFVASLLTDFLYMADITRQKKHRSVYSISNEFYQLKLFLTYCYEKHRMSSDAHRVNFVNILKVFSVFFWGYVTS